MAKPELGTKRVCPETNKKFYDLNRDPIVSPYTGNSYPLSFFEAPAPSAIQSKVVVAKDDEDMDDEDDIEVIAGAPDTVSLEEADGEKAKGDNLPDLDDDDDLVLDDDDDDDDPFLADDEDDDDDDVSGLIVGGRDGDDEE